MANENQTKSDKIKKALKNVFSPESYGDALQLPPGCGGPSQIVITMKKAVCIDGCQGLLNYQNDHITLCLCDGIITVYGENLYMKSFSQTQLTIGGNILGVHQGIYREAVLLENH